MPAFPIALRPPDDRALDSQTAPRAAYMSGTDQPTVAGSAGTGGAVELHMREVARTQPTRGGLGGGNGSDVHGLAPTGAVPGLGPHHPAALVQALEAYLAGAPGAGLDRQRLYLRGGQQPMGGEQAQDLKLAVADPHAHHAVGNGSGRGGLGIRRSCGGLGPTRVDDLRLGEARSCGPRTVAGTGEARTLRE